MSRVNNFLYKIARNFFPIDGIIIIDILNDSSPKSRKDIKILYTPEEYTEAVRRLTKKDRAKESNLSKN